MVWGRSRKSKRWGEGWIVLCYKQSMDGFARKGLCSVDELCGPLLWSGLVLLELRMPQTPVAGQEYLRYLPT